MSKMTIESLTKLSHKDFPSISPEDQAIAQAKLVEVKAEKGDGPTSCVTRQEVAAAAEKIDKYASLQGPEPTPMRSLRTSDWLQANYIAASIPKPGTKGIPLAKILDTARSEEDRLVMARALFSGDTNKDDVLTLDEMEGVRRGIVVVDPYADPDSGLVFVTNSNKEYELRLSFEATVAKLLPECKK